MREHVLAVLILVAVALACYLPVLNSGFASDDFEFAGRMSTGGLASIWKRTEGSFLRPLAEMTILLDYRIWGSRAVGYHLTNILLHSAVAVLLYLFLYQFLESVCFGHSRFAALLSSLLFTALSSHSEAVSWIAGRTDLVATLFALAATGLFTRLLVPGRSGPLIVLACPALLYFCSLLSKESVAMLPVLWIVLLLAARKRSDRPSTRLPVLAIALAGGSIVPYLVIRLHMIGTLTGGYGREASSLLSPSSMRRLLGAIVRTALPPVPWLEGSWKLLLGVLVLTAIVAAGVLLYRLRKVSRAPVAAAALGVCYLISLLPAVSLGVSMVDTQSERLLYFPSTMASALPVLFLFALLRSRRLIGASIGILTLASALALHGVNRRWTDATAIAHEFAEELVDFDPASVWILDVPDTYRGAFVLRNGLDYAPGLIDGSGTVAEFSVGCLVEVPSVMGDTFAFDADDSGFSLRLPATISIGEIDDTWLELNAIADDEVAIVGSWSDIPDSIDLLVYTGRIEGRLLFPARRLPQGAPASGP